jgi:hypothetical protein
VERRIEFMNNYNLWYSETIMHATQGLTVKVCELATVFLPWEQWTETSVWFDDVGILVFHRYIIVDLWQSLSEWRLLLPKCVLECRRENFGA